MIEMHATDLFQSLRPFMGLQPDAVDASDLAELEDLLSYCAEGMETDSRKFLCSIYIQALLKRFHERQSENIYLKQYEIPQIQLFNILIDKFPFVRHSQEITNQALLDAIAASSEATLVDIGIGQGTQVLNLLAHAGRLTNLRKMVIVGIEPAAEALAIAENNIRSFAAQLPFEVEFVAICDFAENVDFGAIGAVRGDVVVNASLALHHIQSDALRNRTIANIRQLNPAAFLLIEPNVNHFETHPGRRFEHSYKHFYAIFQVIDRLDISNLEKNALKQFFGREIEDIMGKNEQDRFEKHEPARHWIERLRNNGFALRNDFLANPFQTDSGVAIRHHEEGYLGFTFGNETVLAVMYAN